MQGDYKANLDIAFELLYKYAETQNPTYLNYAFLTYYQISEMYAAIYKDDEALKKFGYLASLRNSMTHSNTDFFVELQNVLALRDLVLEILQSTN